MSSMGPHSEPPNAQALIPAPAHAAAMNAWQHREYLAACQAAACHPAALWYSGGTSAPWHFHPLWPLGLPANGGDGAVAQPIVGSASALPNPTDQHAFMWQPQQPLARAAPAPAPAPSLYSTGANDIRIAGPGRGCNGTPFQPNLGTGCRVQAPAPGPMLSLPGPTSAPPDAVVYAVSPHAGVHKPHAAPAGSCEPWCGSGVADAVSGWLTTPPISANGQPTPPPEPSPAAMAPTEHGTAAQAVSLSEQGTRRASSPPATVDEAAGMPDGQRSPSSQASRSSAESEPPPPGVVRGPTPMRYHPALPAIDAARSCSELPLHGSCTTGVLPSGQPPPKGSEQVFEVVQDRRVEAVSLLDVVPQSGGYLSDLEPSLDVRVHQLPAAVVTAAEHREEGSDACLLPEVQTALAALVPYGDSSVDMGSHSERDSDVEQACGGVYLRDVIAHSSGAAVAGRSAGLLSPARCLSSSQVAAAQGDSGGGDVDVLALVSQQDIAAAAARGAAAGQSLTASADGLAEPEPSPRSPNAPESPAVRLTQRADAASPAQTSESPTQDQLLAARLAEIAAANRHRLALAPVDRLPPEALAEASREGSPEPEPSAELPVADGEDPYEAIEEETALSEDAADADPAVLAAGPTARPKRTAGGDPMEVCALSVHQVGTSCLSCLVCI